ncbi:hypothetical protein F53441_8412 [Fusarium austroafricanum]|uniref:Uncharacterized protein n=1 Tax=Fusarium austroafricanum TaxID=2364996 RepID=A0A8H4NWK5_9HYPO|nr:hypothetical protein F53441_8412 [Fusarium austroafricanum]
MREVPTKQGRIYTPAPLSGFSSSSRGSKRRKLENNIPVTTLLAAESSDTKRGDKEEGDARELTPSIPLDTSPESAPSSPNLFFTDDGDKERMAVALLRSSREANLEKRRRLIVMEKATGQPPEAKDQSPSLNPSLNSSLSGENHSHSPPPEELASPHTSQESYGGSWVDDVDDELLAGGSSAVMTLPQNTTVADQGSSSKESLAIKKHQ